MIARRRMRLAWGAVGCVLAGAVFAAPAAATVLKVKNNHDSGAGSLRAAVAAASNGDTVSIPAKVGTITLTSGEIDASKTSGSHLTITGAGPTKTTVSGNDASRIFLISTGAVKIENMTLTKGHVTAANSADGGGAIYDDGDAPLGLRHVVVTRNTVTGGGGSAQGGGGVYDNGGNMSLVHSTVSANKVTVTSGFGSGGGGIYNDGGNITLKKAAISGNQATIDTASPSASGGGGIYDNGDHIKMIASSVTGNRAKVNASVSSNVNGGGGIYLNGGGLRATKSTLAGNSATLNGTATNHSGGGGWYSNGGAFNLSATTVSGNKLTATVSGVEGQNGGGGFYLDGTNGQNRAENVTIANNKATINGGSSLDGGGALFEVGTLGEGTFTSVTVAGNSTNQSGGAFYDAPTLRDTIVAGNKATHGGSCQFTVTSTTTSAGHNLSDDKSCRLTKPGDRQGVNPKLGGLGKNGGPTETVALKKGSPAIDHADSHSPSTDQRGFKRDAKPDIGAFEFGAHH
jgi:hypothetical protein